MLIVLGSSGCGKSSLIRAGLIPALSGGRSTSEHWRIAIFHPTERPFEELAETIPRQLTPERQDHSAQTKLWRERLSSGASELRDEIVNLGGGEGQRVLLVADQFEEIFTLTVDSGVRRRYIEALLSAARVESGTPIHLLISMRADFYASCLDYPELCRALETNLHNVSSMAPDQIRENIDQRLTLAGATCEPSFVDSLLADAGAEPGNLALLEHALGQLWDEHGGWVVS